MLSPFETDPSMGTAVEPGLAEQWANALSDPTTRGSLIQFGLQLMQPRPVGQTVAGQVGSAIGSAGEAVARSNAQDIAQQNADTKAEVNAVRSEANQVRQDANILSNATRAEGNAMRNETRLQGLQNQLELGQGKLGISQLLTEQRAQKLKNDQENTLKKLEISARNASSREVRNDILERANDLREALGFKRLSSQEYIAELGAQTRVDTTATRVQGAKDVEGMRQEGATARNAATVGLGDRRIDASRDIAAGNVEGRLEAARARGATALELEEIRQGGADRRQEQRAGTTATQRANDRYDQYRMRMEQENAKSRSLGLATSPIMTNRDWITGGRPEGPPAASTPPAGPPATPPPRAAAPGLPSSPAAATTLPSMEARVPGVTTVQTSQGTFVWQTGGWQKVP